MPPQARLLECWLVKPAKSRWSMSATEAPLPESAAAALSRGAYQVLSLLMPYLEPPAREHLLQIAGAYQQAA